MLDFKESSWLVKTNKILILRIHLLAVYENITVTRFSHTRE